MESSRTKRGNKPRADLPVSMRATPTLTMTGTRGGGGHTTVPCAKQGSRPYADVGGLEGGLHNLDGLTGTGITGVTRRPLATFFPSGNMDMRSRRCTKEWGAGQGVRKERKKEAQ